MNKMCITVAEAAKLASVPETVIRQWAEDFDFPSMRIGKRGGKRLIHVESFNAWLAKRCQARMNCTPKIGHNFGRCSFLCQNTQKKLKNK